MLLQDHLKCNYSWPYHQRVSLKKNFRLLFEALRFVINLIVVMISCNIYFGGLFLIFCFLLYFVPVYFGEKLKVVYLQKKLEPSAFKIGCAQAAKNKWVEMGKQLVSRKVWYDQILSLILLWSSSLCSSFSFFYFLFLTCHCHL